MKKAQQIVEEKDAIVSNLFKDKAINVIEKSLQSQTQHEMRILYEKHFGRFAQWVSVK